jgi:signal transduction histidine kinase
MLEAGRDAWFDKNKILENARFSSEELPKRLARRLLDLQLLPYIVVNNPHIQQVYQSYRHAFDILRDYPPITDLADNDKFSKLLRRLVDEHAPMLDALANGLKEIKRKPLVGPHLQLDSFLEAMLSSRISRRVIAEHHINLNNSRPGYIGIICTDLSLADSIDFAAGRSKQVCIETYGVAPEIIISGNVELKLPYIPAHLDYMLYELLKNASRAVVERHLANSGSSSKFPAIHVRICGGTGGGTDDVTLRISDQGGGIPFDLIKQVWEFGWTDVDNSTSSDSSSSSSYYKDELTPSASSADGLRREGLGLDSAIPGPAIDFNPSPTPSGSRFRMAGLGFGLPLSRLYARYFGGELRLVTMPGYGVDAYLYLKGLGEARAEGKKDWAEQFQGSPSDGVDSVSVNGNAGRDGGTGRGTAAATMPRDGEGIGALGVSPSGVNIF